MIYQPVGEYGGQFPIQRVPGSAWLVVGEWGRWVEGERILLGVDVHLDADDPNHVFLGPEAWAGWPNARRLSDWYNARHRRSMRLREARSTEHTGEDSQRFWNEMAARAALQLSALIRSAPDEEHQVCALDWSPTGQVWRDGARWVKVLPEALS